MSIPLTIYIGHSGQRLELDFSQVNSLDAVKSWLHTQTGVQPRNQILLTAQGKHVRPQTLLTESEIFVFDSGRLSSKQASSSSEGDDPGEDFDPGTPPDTISNQNDLQAWQSLFKSRRNWATSLLSGCDARARQARRYQEEQAVIERSLGVAVSSLKLHLKSGEQKCASVETWSEQILNEHGDSIENWEANVASLRDIPAKPEFVRFLPLSSSSRRLSQQDNAVTLQSFVDVAGGRKAANAAKAALVALTQKVGRIRNDLSTATEGTDELIQAVDQMSAASTASNTSEPVQLMEEIDIVVKKLSSDLEHVQTLPRTQSSISQASKMALLHTRNYLPHLSEYYSEMNDLVQRNYEHRKNIADAVAEHMRSLSRVESILSEVYQTAKTLEISPDEQQSFATLNIVSRLPSVYGALLVESVRRREWVAKMRRDAATLQEEAATYQDEEDKRRKKWIQSLEDVVRMDVLRSNVLGIELSLINEGGSWPMVTREELEQHLEALLQVYGQCAVTEEMDFAIKELDKPTRKQIKHAKAFKNGSMHEAAFGDTSLLLRGDDQNKGLRDTISRLEDELKGQKSRVRKLEDLLHRSSHIGRASSGDMFTPQSGSGLDRHVTMPVNLASQRSDDFSRTDSIRHQRKVSMQGADEQQLARRVVDLENELRAAQDDATSRKNSDAEARKQVEDAVSIKKDLMKNMEAQQREFATERRNLEAELAEAKDKVEELENEIERLVGSRDDERTGADARVATLHEEVARLKADASGHAARAATEQDARAAMERKLDVSENARTEAEEQLQRMRGDNEQRQETESEQLQLLATAHAQLAPGSDTPNGILAIATALEELCRKFAAHKKDLEESVAFAKAENESLWSSNERQKTELSAALQKQVEVEDESRSLQEKISTTEARADSLQQQLNDEQEQLRIFRSKFAEGETGSESLRQRVAEEEARAGKLAAELAQAKSHNNSMDVELMRLQKKHKAYHDTAERSAVRLEKRAEHAKEVSHRLYAQNSRLTRLLERLGFVVSYSEDNMVVERASKVGASTIIDPQQPPGQVSRTVTLSSPPPTRKSSTADEPSDLSVLRWPDAQTAEEETAQFEAYLSQTSRFNIETFSDAVVKRVRDFEYTARKYNKEARESGKRADAYKERSLKLKTEAHAKIAVKDFKEGDLALFLPTRGQAKGAWAAFNVGCPHYFLAEKDGMALGSRDFIVARITKIEPRTVDLSKSFPSQQTDGRSIAESTDADNTSLLDNNDNPFDLSDGLKWWLVHATEERGAGGAPTTPGLGKSTVAAANVDAKGSIRIKRNSKGEDATKHLNKSLDSRRSSSTSKKGVAGAIVPTFAASGNSPTVGSFAEASQLTAGRQRSESQTSTRHAPPGGMGSITGTVASGLGIINDTSQHHDDDAASAPRQATTNDQFSPNHRPSSLSPSKARQRSKSPSKSIRSLQRHLMDPSNQAPASSSASPAKAAAVGSPARVASPVKKSQQAPQQVWENLWSADFSLESPSKKGGVGSKK